MGFDKKEIEEYVKNVGYTDHAHIKQKEHFLLIENDGYININFKYDFYRDCDVICFQKDFNHMIPFSSIRKEFKFDKDFYIYFERYHKELFRKQKLLKIGTKL